jgi:antitoxin (DNA-binding transcriptional repressor) of toxin-antitoxin stability system
MWSVADAKAHLSEVLRKARGGAPQVIGAQDPCIVISLATYQKHLSDVDHDGRWLVDMASRAGGDIPAASRQDDRAGPVLGD